MKYLLILLTLLTVSCESDSERTFRISNDDNRNFNILVNGKSTYHLLYGKDKRTNLCFAYNRLDWNSAVFTNVPCTPEVESLLDK